MSGGLAAIEFDTPQMLVCEDHWDEIAPYCPTVIPFDLWMKIWTSLAHGELMVMKEFREAVEKGDSEGVRKWLPACCKLSYENRQQLLARTLDTSMTLLDSLGQLPNA